MPSAERMIDALDAAEASSRAAARTGARERWTVAAIEALFDLPFGDLIQCAQEVHRDRRVTRARRSLRGAQNEADRRPGTRSCRP
jgi:hypothetical protein